MFSLPNLKISSPITGFQTYDLAQTKKSSYVDQEKIQRMFNNVYTSKVSVIL